MPLSRRRHPPTPALGNRSTHTPRPCALRCAPGTQPKPGATGHPAGLSGSPGLRTRALARRLAGWHPGSRDLGVLDSGTLEGSREPLTLGGGARRQQSPGQREQQDARGARARCHGRGFAGRRGAGWQLPTSRAAQLVEGLMVLFKVPPAGARAPPLHGPAAAAAANERPRRLGPGRAQAACARDPLTGPGRVPRPAQQMSGSLAPRTPPARPRRPAGPRDRSGGPPARVRPSAVRPPPAGAAAARLPRRGSVAAPG